MSWIPVCSADEINDGEMKAFDVGDTRIAVYRVDDAIYVTNNVCTHAFALLTDGWLDGTIVECPLHAAQFDITTGSVLSGPADCVLKTYAVRTDDGVVEVELDCPEMSSGPAPACNSVA